MRVATMAIRDCPVCVTATDQVINRPQWHTWGFVPRGPSRSTRLAFNSGCAGPRLKMECAELHHDGS
jgi:hypothetical protein